MNSIFFFLSDVSLQTPGISPCPVSISLTCTLNLTFDFGFLLRTDLSYAVAGGKSAAVRHKHLNLVVADHFWWASLLQVMLGPEPAGKPLTF